MREASSISDASRPRVGIFGLTGCAGDQLQILNCEDKLLGLARRFDLVDWVMVRSVNDHGCPLDVALVEGVVATRRDLAELRRIRERAEVLVAIGTCAVWGGLPAMRNDLPREVLQREVCADVEIDLDTVEARPVADFVEVDLALPGCPIERHELLRMMASLALGTVPELPDTPVCWECITRENLCRVLRYGEVCCGAMTRAGCGARCPSHAVSCAGCRGPVEEPHYDANVTMFADRGISWIDISARMRNFSAPVWMTRGIECEDSHD